MVFFIISSDWTYSHEVFQHSNQPWSMSSGRCNQTKTLNRYQNEKHTNTLPFPETVSTSPSQRSHRPIRSQEVEKRALTSNYLPRLSWRDPQCFISLRPLEAPTHKPINPSIILPLYCLRQCSLQAWPRVVTPLITGCLPKTNGNRCNFGIKGQRRIHWSSDFTEIGSWVLCCQIDASAWVKFDISLLLCL